MTDRKTEAAMPPLPAATLPARRHRGRWVVLLLLLSFCGMGWASWQLASALGAFAWGFQPPVMAAAQHSEKDVIGDLGGMPVKISRFVAEYVEYEGDPGWSGPRKGPPPVRTYASRIESFGFELRYPDMATLLTREMWADPKRYNIYNTPWMTVGVISGKSYPGRGFMNRIDLKDSDLRSQYWWEDRFKVKEKKFGLTAYRLTRKPPPFTGTPGEFSIHFKTVYLYRDKAENVITRIDCSDLPHEGALCTQKWDMGEYGVAADLRVMYRRGLLEHWREIQQKVTQVVLGFRVDPSASQASQPLVKSSSGELQ